jgi:hypothetical protein
MDLADKELKVVLASLYRYRGEVSGASQEERNKLESVEALIAKIEAKVGTLKAPPTAFDREMGESLKSIRKDPPAGKKK